MLKKYLHDVSHLLSYETLDVDSRLSYKEKPTRILIQKDKVLHNKTIPLVKVLWHNHAVEEAMRETKEKMQKKYHELI